MATPLRRLPSSAFLSLALAAAAGRAQETPPPRNIELVFDASGSMMTSTKRFTSYQDKVEIAKDEVKRFITNLPDKNVKLAVRVFGTQEQLACADIKLLQPLAPLRKDDVVKLIEPLHPATHGRTPIAKSLEMALEDFHGETAGTENLIILLTDGLESCSGDVDKAVDKIVKSGVNLKVNIVGFDVLDEGDNKAAVELRDIATKTGGKAEFPKTQAELEQSFKTMAPPPKPAPAPEAAAPEGIVAFLTANRIPMGVASIVLLSTAVLLAVRLRGGGRDDDE